MTVSTKRSKMFGLLALGAAGIATVIATIAGCGGSGNPGGGDDRFTMFTLTTSVSPANGGQLSRDPYATTYQNGTEVTLTATPAAGFRFDGWSDTSLTQVPSVPITMTKNIDITAYFVPASTPEGYSLTINRTPEDGGTVTRDPSQSHYSEGMTVSVTATAYPGYTFAGWSGSGAPDSTLKTITVTMDSDKELTAIFMADAHTLTTGASPPGSGMVMRDPEQATFAHNAQVTVIARPNEGYIFVGWADPNVPANDTVTVTMTGDRVLTARFQMISTDHHSLTVHPIPPDGGRIEIIPEAEAYIFGSEVTVRAIPKDGYTFNGWTGIGDRDLSNAELTVIVTGDMDLTAQFRQGYKLDIVRNPEDGGTVTPASGQVHEANAQIPLVATPASGYRFVNWTSADGTVRFVDENNASTSVAINSNTTVTANFKAICTLTVAWNPTAGGTTTPTSGRQYDAGTAVSITATAASGYSFLNWTVVSGTATFANANNANTTVTMTANTTIRANFQKTFTLTINRNPAVGSASSASGTNLDSGAVVNITATPPSTHRFDKWTLESGTATLGDANNAATTITIGSNTTITANFWRTYTLTANRDPADGGTVFVNDVASTGTAVAYDSSVAINITATPNNMSRFVKWTRTAGTVTFADSNAATTTVTLNANSTIRANFVGKPTPSDTGRFTDSRDDQTYRWVKIGTQTWMAENLNYDVPGVTTDVCYQDRPDSCAKYGRLYNWATAMDSAASSTTSPSRVQGVCPVGWHVPSDAEWETLVKYVDPNATGSSFNKAGTKLKSTSGWTAYSGITSTNDYGFSALPGGDGGSGGYFSNVGNYGRWWSATGRDAANAWYRSMLCYYEFVDWTDIDKTLLFSLRCVRD